MTFRGTHARFGRTSFFLVATLIATVTGHAASQTGNAAGDQRTARREDRTVTLTTSRPRRPGFRARVLREAQVEGHLRAHSSGLVVLEMPSRMRARFVAEYTVVDVDAEGRPVHEQYLVEEAESTTDGRPRPLLRAGTILDVDRSAAPGRRLSIGRRFVPRARARRLELMLLPDLEDHAVDRASEPTAAVSVGSTWSLPVDEIASVVAAQTTQRLGPSLFEASATLLGPATAFGIPGLEVRQQVVSRGLWSPMPGFRHVDPSRCVDRMERRVFFPDDASLPPLRSETVYRYTVDADGDVDGTPVRIDGELITSVRETWLLP